MEEEKKGKITINANVLSDTTLKDFQRKAELYNAKQTDKKKRVSWYVAYIVYIQLIKYGYYNTNKKYGYWFYKTAKNFPFDETTVYKAWRFLQDAKYILMVKNPTPEKLKDIPALELFIKEKFEKRKATSICFIKILFIQPKAKDIPDDIQEIDSPAHEPLSDEERKENLKKLKEAFKGINTHREPDIAPAYNEPVTAPADIKIDDIPLPAEAIIEPEIKTDTREPDIKPKVISGIKTRDWQQ